MPKQSCLGAALLMMVVLAPATEGFTVTLYMAPNGSDAWTGRLERPNAAGTDGPVATLAGACDAVRRARQDVPAAEAARVGNAAGALAVTRQGAMPSLPHRDAVNRLLGG